MSVAAQVRFFEEIVADNPLAFDAAGRATCGCVARAEFRACDAHSALFTAMEGN